MSRPVARVAFSVLIAFAVVLAIYTSVQGLSSKDAPNSAQVHTVNGIQTNLNHLRSSSAELELQGAEMQSGNDLQSGKGSGHGCESEQNSVPID